MGKLNENYRNLPESYLFSRVEQKIEEFQTAHPERPVVRLSIGDVTRPLAPAVCRAMAGAAREMGTAPGVHGYGPEQG